MGQQVAAQNCVSSFTTHGTTVPDTSGCFQLTSQGAGFSSGAIWSEQTINLSNDFDFTFSVNQCGAADGVVFVLQKAGPSISNGDTGGTLGYYSGNGAFAQSLGVEMDIYQNNSPPYYDPDNSHLMLALNGNPTAIQGPVSVAGLGNCNSHILHITWNHAAPLLTVQLDGVTLFRYTQNLINTVFGGNPVVWFGFVGSTGGSTATQVVCPVRLTATVSPPHIVSSGSNTLCAGSHVTLSVAGQPAGSVYQWSPAASLSTTHGAAVVATPVSSTTYQLLVTTPGGCQRRDSIRLLVLPRPNVTVSPRQVICPGASAQLTATSPGVGTSQTWSPSESLNTAIGQSVIATPAATTLYTVTTSGGAFCTRQDTVMVIVPPPLQLTASATLPTTPGVSTILTATSAIAGVTYAWQPTTGLSAATGATVMATPTTTMTYTVTATDAHGCTEQASVVAQPFQLPNIITPNGDGLNDTFRPLVSLEPVTLQVFNRWGRLVFEQANYVNTWAAENLPSGTYYYRLITAKEESWKGWVEVVR